jgi:hypothetical protein
MNFVASSNSLQPYAKKIISNFKMSECKPVKTPLPRDCNLSLMDSPDEVDPRVQSE